MLDDKRVVSDPFDQTVRVWDIEMEYGSRAARRARATGRPASQSRLTTVISCHAQMTRS